MSTPHTCAPDLRDSGVPLPAVGAAGPVVSARRLGAAKGELPMLARPAGLLSERPMLSDRFRGLGDTLRSGATSPPEKLLRAMEEPLGSVLMGGPEKLWGGRSTRFERPA